MKYVILHGDGLGDRPLAELGGRTPLAAARTPNLDGLVRRGLLGLVRTIPEGFPPGSDVGTMTILGYDPGTYHTGRSPIEAASMGITLDAADVAFRCNLVSLAPDGAGGERMVDFTAGHISSDEAHQLMDAIERALGDDSVTFYGGVSYRHLMVWHGGHADLSTTPPHDITGETVERHRPRGPGAEKLHALMDAARPILAEHSVNQERRRRGLPAATDVWLWGQGRQVRLPSLRERFGLSGAVISAVDLVRGLGVLAGLEVVKVPGATGFIDTNYAGKVAHGLAALERHDFLLLHVEAPDECGHMGDARLKVRAIEDFDREVVGPMAASLGRFGAWRLLVQTDHATPVALRTHSEEPVPFVLIDSRDTEKRQGVRYTESDAGASGLLVAEGHRLIDRLVSKGG